MNNQPTTDYELWESYWDVNMKDRSDYILILTLFTYLDHPFHISIIRTKEINSVVGQQAVYHNSFESLHHFLLIKLAKKSTNDPLYQPILLSFLMPKKYNIKPKHDNGTEWCFFVKLWQYDSLFKRMDWFGKLGLDLMINFVPSLGTACRTKRVHFFWCLYVVSMFVDTANKDWTTFLIQPGDNKCNWIRAILNFTDNLFQSCHYLKLPCGSSSSSTWIDIMNSIIIFLQNADRIIYNSWYTLNNNPIEKDGFDTNVEIIIFVKDKYMLESMIKTKRIGSPTIDNFQTVYFLGNSNYPDQWHRPGGGGNTLDDPMISINDKWTLWSMSKKNEPFNCSIRSKSKIQIRYQSSSLIGTSNSGDSQRTAVFQKLNNLFQSNKSEYPFAFHVDGFMNGLRIALNSSITSRHYKSLQEHLISEVPERLNLENTYRKQVESVYNLKLGGHLLSYGVPSFPEEEYKQEFYTFLNQKSSTSDKFIIKEMMVNPTLLVGLSGIYKPEYDGKQEDSGYTPKKIISGFDLILKTDSFNHDDCTSCAGKPLVNDPLKTELFQSNLLDLSRMIILQYLTFLSLNHGFLHYEIQSLLSKKSIRNLLIWVTQILYLNQDNYDKIRLLDITHSQLTLLVVTGNDLNQDTLSNHGTHISYNTVDEEIISVEYKPNLIQEDETFWLCHSSYKKYLNYLCNPQQLNFEEKDLLNRRSNNISVHPHISVFVQFALTGYMNDSDFSLQSEKNGIYKMSGHIENHVESSILEWSQSLQNHYISYPLQWSNSIHLSVLFNWFLSIYYPPKLHSLKFTISRSPSIPFNYDMMKNLVYREEFIEDTNFSVLCFLSRPLSLLLPNVHIRKNRNHNPYLILLNLRGSMNQIFFPEKSNTTNVLPTPNIFLYTYNSTKQKLKSMWISLSLSQLQIVLASSIWLILLKQ